MSVLPPQEVVVIWEWEWKEYEAELSCGTSDITHISETVLESDSDETNCEQAVQKNKNHLRNSL